MNKRLFGVTSFNASEVGLGCWQLGGDCWGDVEEEEALGILRASVDAGVNFLDTADVYGAGRSEELVGKFLRERSENLFVATKLGRQAHVYPDQYTSDNLRGCTEASLRRLGVEALDLTQLHCPPPAIIENGEVFEVMREQVAAGLIKSWGVSVESVEEGLLCLEQEGLTSLQVIFNVFRRKPLELLFEKAKAKNVAIIVRLPLASGLLSGKMSSESTFAENDHRGYNEDGQFFNVGETFAGLGLAKGCELADQLIPMVPDGMSMAAMALRWILDFDAVSTIIPGASRVEQAHDNAAVSDLPPLSGELHEKLKAFYEDSVSSHVRGLY
jgi:aryl-alcohol dehydrogenase-like predicted oxidoreductase